MKKLRNLFVVLLLLFVFVTGFTELKWNEGKVQEEASGTAMWCALMRAMSAKEDIPSLNSGDYLAEIFLPDEQKELLKTQEGRDWARRQQPPGMYAMMIARTFYYDNAVREALLNGYQQVVILGTGFDTRPYRLQKYATAAKFFEVDTLPTLQYKKEILQKANIPIPKNVIFVPIDFLKDSFEEAFAKAGGYDKTKKTIFIWEGVTYYINQQAVDATLDFVEKNSAVGSQLCFDYEMEIWNDIDQSELQNLIALGDFWKRHFPNEPSGWKIDVTEVGSFLKKHGLKVEEHLRAKEGGIQRKFFSIQDRKIGHVPVIFGIVKASVE
jgi:methyltransferase (TIGR00027 family)